MALKKDGTLIPIVLISWIIRSKKEPLYRADTTPRNKPIIIAIDIAENASTNVFGSVSEITVETFLPWFTNEVLK